MPLLFYTGGVVILTKVQVLRKFTDIDGKVKAAGQIIKVDTMRKTKLIESGFVVPIPVEIKDIEKAKSDLQTVPENAVASPSYTGDTLNEIIWNDGAGNVFRTDTFTYSEDVGAGTETTTEVRVLFSGESLTMITTFDADDSKILGYSSSFDFN